MSHPPTPMAPLKRTDKEIKPCRQRTLAAPWIMRAVKYLQWYTQTQTQTRPPLLEAFEGLSTKNNKQQYQRIIQSPP